MILRREFEEFSKEGKKVKNKILFISLAVVLALSVGLIGCGCGGNGGGDEIPPEPQKIIVSLARDTNEALAVFDQLAAGPVYREFVEYVNNDLGGVHLEFGPNDHQGMDEMFLTVIRGGQVKPLED